MGERKPHSYFYKPQPRGRLLTHGHGEYELDGEVQPGGEMVAGGGLWGQQPGEEAAARRWRRPLPPSPHFKLGDGAGMEEGFHLTAAAL